jgi:hypothetical protein
MLTVAPYEAPAAVAAAISSIGRTEDLRFSPDGTLLAIAGFAQNAVLLLHVDTAGPAIRISDWSRLTAEGADGLHGLDFLDDRTLVLANRNGAVLIVPIPPEARGGRSVNAPVTGRITRTLLRELHMPGSVAVARRADGSASLFVCDNGQHRVTRHVIDARGGMGWQHVAMRRGLDIPDGIALSRAGDWIAVSSHATRNVLLFRNRPLLGPWSRASATLEGAGFPHGLRFMADGGHILVADAGSPFVNVYRRPPAGWRGRLEPHVKWQVLSGLEFAAGRKSLEEGGPKGLELTPDGRALAISCESVPLRFFALPELPAAN